MLVGRLNVFTNREKKTQDSHFFLLSYCDRLVINLCQRSDSDEIILEELKPNVMIIFFLCGHTGSR